MTSDLITHNPDIFPSPPGVISRLPGTRMGAVNLPVVGRWVVPSSMGRGMRWVI